MKRVIRALTAAAMLTAILLIGVGQGPAHAEVTAVEGGAYGYFSNVSLFGGPPSTRGPAPTVTLPPGGSAVPITATAPTGSVMYGPATLFSSGPLTVSTQGTTGSTGSVTSTTNIQSVNTSGQEVFTANNVASSCTATEAGASGSTTITNGTLQTSEGDPNVQGDETVIQVPTNPAPNTTYNGQIESVGDSFRYVFNEQIVNPDGSITVNAAHEYLLGPTAIGDLIVGQSFCGVTATTSPPPPPPPPPPSNTTPVANDDSYKTKEDKKREVAAPGVLSNDSDPDADSLTVSLVSGPKKAKKFTLNPDGSFTYKPKKNFHGKDSFTYTVSDGKGGTDTATVTIKVKSVKD